MAAAHQLPDLILQRYRRKFNMFDINKNGVISVAEMASVAKVLGYKLSQSEMMRIFGRTDLDDSGGITFEEFVQKMQERVPKKDHNRASIRERFLEYDPKHTGYVTAEDAQKVLGKELGFDESKTEALVERYDKNKDYRLSIEEFVDFYARVQELKDTLQKAFQEYDKNGNGFVELDEAKAILKPKGYSDEEVETIMKVHDTNHDGKLCYQEFAGYWNIPL